MRWQRKGCARRVDPARAAQRTRSRRSPHDSRRKFRASLWGQRHLPFELGCERHRAGAATGAAHGDENVLLLLLVEVGAIKQLPRLLFEQRVQRERAIRNLILRHSLRSGLGLPCGDAPDISGSLLALRHSYLRRLANGRPAAGRLQPDCNPWAYAAARSAADGGARFLCPRVRAHDTIPTYRVIASSGFRLLSTGRRLR